jgi:SAM-dependent methyltransferase
MTHREQIKQWLGEIKLMNKEVIDWGSGSKPAMRYIWHSDCFFTTVDQNDLIASDRRALHHYVHDMQEPILLKKYDVAFCIEALEHCWDSAIAVKNIHDNLKSGGELYLTLPFMFRVHNHDDWHRYTHHGLTKLLENAGFTIQEIKTTGGSLDEAQGYLVKATA